MPELSLSDSVDPSRDIGLSRAQSATEAAIARAEKLGLAVSVVVLDRAGMDVLATRMDGAPWFTPQVARAKARTATIFRANTEDLGELKSAEPELIEQIEAQLTFRLTTMPGGIVLRQDNSVIGAIGVSGAPPALDVDCAQAGAATLGS